LLSLRQLMVAQRTPTSLPGMHIQRPMCRTSLSLKEMSSSSQGGGWRRRRPSHGCLPLAGQGRKRGARGPSCHEIRRRSSTFTMFVHRCFPRAPCRPDPQATSRAFPTRHLADAEGGGVGRGWGTQTRTASAASSEELSLTAASLERSSPSRLSSTSPTGV
jgi:hypothetical protein